MENREAQQDYSRFWVRLRLPDGRLTHPASDEEAFEKEFGERARRAFGEIQHYQGNPPDNPTSRRRHSRAQSILRRQGIDPDALLDGYYLSTRIEDL